MKDEREQLERLLACSLDRELNPDERLRVQRAISEDPAAATAHGEYRRLHALLERWRSLPANVDWPSFQRGISRAMKRDATVGEPDADLEAVDRKVREWAGPMPDVDWAAFRARVSMAVRAEAARSGLGERPRYRLPNSVRWFVPIAAAAMIAIAVFRTPGPGPRILDQGGSSSPLVLVSLDVPNSRGRVTLQFDESAPAIEDAAEANGTAYVISAPPIGFADGDDEAAYY